ncbi:MAG: glycosyltransferase family 4 protein [Planctomycetes bacterium]|nr:glycosyltransferase family 4 protein [Planctomycetota bacterium]
MKRALAIVANTRLPSERAQGLQVVQSAAAFARLGLDVELLHAKRARELALPPGTDLFAHCGVSGGAHPRVSAVECFDILERFPRAWQFWPSRLQEWSFSAQAASRLVREAPPRWVLSREIECGERLVRAGHRGVFLELHAVPGGRLRRALLRRAARGVRGIVAISGGVRDDLLALDIDARALTVEHDAFEPQRFEPRPTRSEARRALDLPPERAVVVYTGGLLPWKGVDVLVEAARRVPEALVVIAGGMEQDVAALRARSSGIPNVRIDGFQPPKQVALYLAAADVGVAPNRSTPAISARYTSPLKVFEAMAVGLPLVASDLPSLREVLRHGSDAWLVRADDAEELAGGLKKLLGDADLRRALGKSLAARSAEHTWDARARRLVRWMGERTS